MRSMSIMSALEDQARGRAMSEQTALAICQPSFGHADSPTPAQHNTFRHDHAGLRGNGPHQRNLEFKRGLADALLQRRLDSQSHAAVEQRSREATVHGASRIEMDVTRLRSDDNAPAHRLGHITVSYTHLRAHETRHD